MKTRLFNSNGGETYTETGNKLAEEVYQFTKQFLQTLVFDEVAVTCVEERIVAGAHQWKIEREVINYQI